MGGSVSSVLCLIFLVSSVRQVLFESVSQYPWPVRGSVVCC